MPAKYFAVYQMRIPCRERDEYGLICGNEYPLRTRNNVGAGERGAILSSVEEAKYRQALLAGRLRGDRENKISPARAEAVVAVNAGRL